jgi:hypothetical protein
VEAVKAVPFSEEHQLKFAMYAMCLTNATFEEKNGLNLTQRTGVMTKQQVERLLETADIDEYIPSGLRWTFRCHRLDYEPWPCD